MGKDSKIEWTDHTFNPWWGCVKVSGGCKNCYAETFSNRLGGDWWGDDKPRRFFGDKHWNQILKWNRKATALGERHKVFCGSMCDIFEIHPDPDVNEQLDYWRGELFGFIDATPNLDWLLLTKRPENIPYFGGRIGNMAEDWPNIWLGVTVENQKQAEIRIPQLVEIPAKVKWLSCEPLLEKVRLWEWLFKCSASVRKQDEVSKEWLDEFEPSCETRPSYDGVRSDSRWRFDGEIYQHHHGYPVGHVDTDPAPLIDWVIVGGESGGGKRTFDANWARHLRHQCKEAGVPFFMKQMDKVEPIPEDLMIQEFPDD